MKKKKRSVEEKIAVVLEGLQGRSTISEICRRNGISQSQYYKWRDKFLEGGKEALETYKQVGDHQLKARINELEGALGRATMFIELLKKNDRMSGH